MHKRVHAESHLAVVRLVLRTDGTGNAAACHVALLASNNLTASCKGGVQPSVACLHVYGEPTLSHNASTSGSRCHCRRMKFSQYIIQSPVFVCDVRTVRTVRTKLTRVGNSRLKANHYERIHIRYLSLLRNTTVYAKRVERSVSSL